MATKSKNINVFVKILCVLLSVCCITGAFVFACNVVDAANAYNVGLEDLNGKPLNKKVSDSYEVKNLVFNDIETMNSHIVLSDTVTLKKYFESQRDKYIDTVYSEYISAKESVEYDEYSDEDLDSLFTNDYYIDYNDLTFVIYISSEDNIRFDLTEDEAKALITAKYDEFLNTKDYSAYVQLEDRNTVDACFSVVDRKNRLEYSTIDKGITDEDILSHEYAFIVKNGVLTCSKGFDGLFADLVDAETGKCSVFNDKYEYRLYVDTSDTTYAGYNAAISNALCSSGVNLMNSAVYGGLLALAALVLAFVSFVICGKKGLDGKVKLAFIDKVPTDLHIAITVGLQILLGFLFGLSYDAIINYCYPFEKYLYLAVYAAAAAMWALFIECSTSFIRVCKSEKKLYKNTLIYLFIKYIIVKPCAFIFNKIKAYFTYKPENFTKTLRRIVISYGILNAFFAFVILCCLGSDAAGGACFFFAVSVAVNIALLVFAVRYIKALDAIITAAHYRQAPQVDYNKLPNSLKTLVNSLNYTRTELQNAVEKAVKDERMRTELITNVSHDLKTPLTSIITYVDLLKGCDIQDETAKEYIGVLDEKGGKLKRLIDDLVEASKITSGVVTIEPIDLNLSELATHAVVEHQQEFANSGLELVFKGDKGTVNAFADGNKTFRIIENLLSNARKYSLRGTRVYADVYETQNFSIFEIKNTSAEALDISADELKERFVRGDKSRANEGSGLGLSIADNLCKAQKGHLNITIDGDLFKAQVMLPKTK